ncbi:hypothetical protein DOTSEDRAFT_75124 [Dothistroma septosporum NZE10]|uniref:Ubiquitin-like-conjugating enzyme ATG10 n=1 Tax=Dothistroma septosporum (strain NZE10 / CBS 128990) TaxID=675120 RepID=M2XIK7_DOTSN|nr:hypothetical protein DOTSEDRAFT_75124 [Dothistroma septosporum NZE10]
MSVSVGIFDIAIERLQKAWHQLQDQSDWENVQALASYGLGYLRITRQIPRAEDERTRCGSSESGAEVAMDESDDEALPVQRTPRSAVYRVIYDIVHSTTYEVPVLYLTFSDSPGKTRPSPDEIYPLLVPNAYRPQIKSVGIMGALSTTEHPIMGVPAYFIHPCRTQEAMAPLLLDRDVKPEHYLMLWLGMIGGSAGLNMPVELAQHMTETSVASHKGGA